MFKNWRKVLLAGIISISLVGTGYVGHDLISTPNVSAESASKNAPGYQKNAAATQLDEIIAAKELGKDLGVEVQFVSTTWPDMLKDLQADKFDIAVGGVTRNTARQKNAYVSQGYISFGKVPLIRAEDKDKYLTIEDINKPSVRIGVNPGGTNESFVRQYLSNANVTVVQNNLDIPGLVADGTYDVMITDTVEAMLYARKDERLYAALTDKPFTNSEKGYMIPRGDFIYASYLEMWMDEMKLQGKFDALYKKWIE